MPRSERIDGTPVCDLSRRWTIAPTLAHLLLRLDETARARFSAEGLRWAGLFIISGYRSPQVQSVVNPANPNSAHGTCPAVAADLRIGDVAASATPVELWQFLGQIWKSFGGIWGGDFATGFAGGSTPDVNHFQLPSP